MRVWDVMKSPVVTVDEGTPLRQAMALMGGRGIRRLPVVRRGALVGILTDRDCRRAWASSAPTLAAHELTSLLDEVPVSEVMTREVITLSPETSLREAVRLIHERKIGGFLRTVRAGGRVRSGAGAPCASANGCAERW